MKVLVATKIGQGKRKNDFNFCDEGEIVRFGMECDREKVDGSCGCKRSLSGVATSKTTTTMKIADLALTNKRLEEIILSSLQKDGWVKTVKFIKDNQVKEVVLEKDINWAKRDAKELLRIASLFPVNAIIEKRGNKFVERKT